ncbi:GIY-YIG nuclease family protein [Mucilaginibacter sp. RS28]|uniref:GIY-YIG nuclease family protein n=1 Tax=Mucilaginibacter straminoryzae TaxID=2932774 RepID=A0A9X1X408_9SPHI|nr:exonuclease domain-containing protein [Mucilaginibacter straminoryzae]MCJ8209945.1 GIY-YIG nuclease family protein [Mucilaginibacter straminoryzae]
MYAIVDIETTGGHANANGITEIGICLHDGKEVVKRYQTLVNPGRDIPVYIRALTGISNEMVATAPTFKQVAQEIYELLQDKIFVAHNVNFDYSFVRHHLSLAGFNLNSNKLCTVRLSRKILPGLPSYSLGKLCNHLDIPNYDRHRAGGDAEATAMLFSLLMQEDKEGHIEKALKQRSREQVLPANLPKSNIERLPYTPGVYYFHDAHDRVIYVGKAVNIKKRVCSHFTGNNTGYQRQEFMRNIHRISFQECGTELMAFVLENIEIKRLWPQYNRSQKGPEFGYGLYTFEDQRGYMRLAVDKRRKHSTPVYSCGSMFEGRTLLMRLIDQFGLCPKLCFIQKNSHVCTGPNAALCACEGHEEPNDYNAKVANALHELKHALPTFALRDEGRLPDEHSCILIEEGKFYGMGYISHYFEVNNMEQLKAHLKPYPGNDYIRNMVLAHAEKHPHKKVMFVPELATA